MRKTTVTLCVSVIGLVLAGAMSASAQTISGLSIVKNAGNSPDEFQDGTVTSFQRTTTVAVVSSTITGFQTRYAEGVGADVGATGSDDVESQTSDYQVTFTVTAPQSYAVDVTTSANGAFTLVDDGSNSATADMSAVTGSFSGGGLTLSSGTISLSDPGSLSSNGGGNSAFHVTSSATFTAAGNNIPRTHTFRFTWSASCRSNNGGFFDFGGGDECALRMGLPITYSGQSAGNYPGVGSRNQSLDGHFVGVSVRSLCGDGVLQSGEVCDEGSQNGTSGSCCNADCTFRAAGQTCRPVAGGCDLADLCTGSSATCPADAKLAAGTVCRAAAGSCDVAETCNGTSTACPTDAFKSAGIVCRSAAGVCDLTETCSGLSAACPADAKSTGVCRSSAGICDTPESCNGASNDCPFDHFVPAGTSCPDDGLVCTADVCDGFSAACTHPAGNAGVECRAVAGPCDIADHCDGVSTTCPADSVEGAFVVCRPAAGECDLAENCNGVSAACPADAKVPSGTTCTDDGNPCSSDVCNGSSNACTHPAGNAGATCRAAAGECDLAETCTGASTSCPSDAKKPSGTGCTSDGNVCTLDQCNGSSVTCQHPAGNGGTECRASAGECDPAESCDGASPTCPGDAKSPAGTACTADTNGCTDDVCDGSGNTCMHPNNTAPCDDGLYCTVNDTCSGGSCVGAPRDCNAVGDQCHNGVCDENLDACVGPNKPDGTSCVDSNPCTSPDTCTAGTCGGPIDYNACLDEFQCYKVKTTSGTPAFAPILNVQLTDAIESGLFDLKKRKHLCAPADRGGTGTADPATHLTTYLIKPSIGQPFHIKQTNIVVTNAIGTLHVDTVKAEYLFMPTAKNLSNANAFPPAPVFANHNVDLFKCYKVKVTKGQPKFPTGVQATVSDQFTTPVIYDLKKPRHLCLPVDKGGDSDVIKNAARKMLCYKVKPALGQPLHLRRLGLYIANDFGQARLDTIKEDELCVPSTSTP